MGRAAVGHVDCDAFYASAERLRRHHLRGKPIGVLGNQGACVVAKSYEMRAAGVKTGMPIWEAVRLCPDGVFVKRDFRWYEVLSRLLLTLVRGISTKVEYYSVDEFFFEVRGGSLQAAAEALRERALREVGVPVTVGVAWTRTLAKLISDSAKPFGARAVLDPDAERQLMAGLPVTEASGIAARRAARLAEHGITTCLDLARADRLLARRLLTRTGESLWYELNGECVVPPATERPPHKVISRGGSLGGPTADPDRLWAWAARNLERLVEELEFYRVLTGKLTLSLLHADGTEGSARAPLQSSTDRFDLLLEVLRPALARCWNGRAVSRMHLFASGLEWPTFVQRGLFDPAPGQARAVAEVKRQVNSRMGRFALRSGATLPLHDVYADETQSYDICDVRGKTCF
jgi:nucleotidyltransferase/DNA polymerase involved in DNA repair